MLPHCDSVAADALLQCINSGDKKKMREILEEYCRDHKFSIKLCKQMLVVAEQTAQIPTIKLLLENDTRNSEHFQGRKLSALWVAVLYGYQKSAELLVRSSSVDLNEPLGVNFRELYDSKSTVLHVLIQTPNPFWTERIFALAVDRGANFEARDSHGRTPLHYTVSKDLVKLTELLLKKKANVNAKDNKGETPLLMAVRSISKADKLLPLLMSYGADVTKELVNFYLNNGTCVNSSTIDNHRLLHLAAGLEDPGVLETLLDHGANVDLRTDNGRTALHFACEKSRLQNIRKLLKANADMLVEDQDGNTPFALIEVKSLRNQCIRVMLRKLARIKALRTSSELKDERFINESPPLKKYYQAFYKEVGKIIDRHLQRL